MSRAALIAAVLLAARPAFAGTPAAARPAPTAATASASVGMVSLSLVEALAAIRQPQLSGVFSFISEQNSPFAFADLAAREPKSLKLYLEKLDADMKAANGLTAWDHDVCASLVNFYSSPLASSLDKPDEKRMSKINQCVLANVVPLEEIVARRKK